MLTIHNIERIKDYSNVNIVVEETNLAYIFYIDNQNYLKGFGAGSNTATRWNIVTLSRIHPPKNNHPHKHYYCMTFHNQQMWLQINDVMDSQQFLIKMTSFIANII